MKCYWSVVEKKYTPSSPPLSPSILSAPHLCDFPVYGPPICKKNEHPARTGIFWIWTTVGRRRRQVRFHLSLSIPAVFFFSSLMFEFVSPMSAWAVRDFVCIHCSRGFRHKPRTFTLNLQSLHLSSRFSV